MEADVLLADGSLGRAAVPSGASTGEHEAVELRDGNPARYQGKGVQTVAANVTDIIGPEIVGLDALEQRKLDRLAREQGVRDRLVFLAGGTQVTPELAREAGADEGFGRGTKSVHVATALIKMRKKL
mgnify:CR=1 FL=1